MDPPAITLEVVVGVIVGWVGVSYTVDVLADLLAVLVIGVVPVIGVEMIADENINVLAAVVTSSEFTLPSPREDSMPFG